MTSRRSLSPMRRLKIFERAQGKCHICYCRIQPGQKWEAEHIVPLALDGKDDESNLAPVHEFCHALKTKADVADIARAKRRKAKHLGIKKRSQWQSKWRKKMNGEVILR